MPETVEVKEVSIADQPNPFANNSWGDNHEPPKPTNEVPNNEATPPTPSGKTPPASEQPISNEWYKEYNWENPESAKKEISELREFKQNYKAPEEKKFANETSKSLYEAWVEGKEDVVYNIIENKRKIDRLTQAEVDKNTAAEIVKLSLKQKNNGLSDDDVEFVFNKKYQLPVKPQKDDTELEDDYAVRVSQWQAQVQEKERELIIDAKMARPELEKLKTELVLPNTNGEDAAKTAEAQQKELERLGQLRNLYKQTLDNDFKKFNGYEIKYKDEEVEIPVNFGVTDEEKAALKAELENFDVDDFWTKRWFNQDGSPNIQQTMSDIILLRQKDNVLQKMVNEIGTKMREHYIKLRTNTNVTGGQNTNFDPQKQNGNQVSPFATNSWTEKQTVLS